MISIKEEYKADPSWNDRLLNSGLGTIYQTKERAEFLSASNHKTLFLKFLNKNNEIVAQLLVQISSRFPFNGSRNKILNNLPHIKKKKCSWLYGPIIFDPNENLNVFLALDDYLKKKKFSSDGWTHPLSNFNSAIFSNSFNAIKWGTYVIDLSQPKEVIYKKISKHSGRKNIERSIKKGVSIETITDETLYEYYKLKTQTKIDSGQNVTEFEPMLRRWKKFKPLGFSGFLAKHNGVAIGGLLFTFFNDYIIEIGVARSKEDRIKNLYSQDLIKWKIIEWGIENNMRYYDLAGFNPNPISKKEEGISRFKQKWGGDTKYYHRLLEKQSLFMKLIPK